MVAFVECFPSSTVLYLCDKWDIEVSGFVSIAVTHWNRSTWFHFAFLRPSIYLNEIVDLSLLVWLLCFHYKSHLSALFSWIYFSVSNRGMLLGQYVNGGSLHLSYFLHNECDTRTLRKLSLFIIVIIFWYGLMVFIVSFFIISSTENLSSPYFLFINGNNSFAYGMVDRVFNV